MAQQVKVLASKPGDLSWILRTHIILKYSVTYTCVKLQNSVQGPIDFTEPPTSGLHLFFPD